MRKNTVTVGDHTLTVSMATLYRADEALAKAGRKSVMETFADVLENLDLSSGQFDLASLSKALRVVSFPVLVTILAAFLNMPEKKALDGPLSEGLPTEWLSGLFSLMLANVPQGDDVDDAGDADGEPEGNDRAA
jgi:hypothetical protein